MKALWQNTVTFAQKITRDNIKAYSAEATLFIVISLFPFLMFLLSLMQFLPIDSNTLLDFMNTFLPSMISSRASNILTPLLTQKSGVIVITTVFGFLWAGSQGFLSIERGLNGVYCRENRRTYLFSRLYSIIYTILFALLIVVLLLIFLFGNRLMASLTSVFPHLTYLTILIKSIRYSAGLVMLIVIFDMMYRFIPNRKDHGSNFITELPGAVLAAVGWLAFSALYSCYIDNFSNYSIVYGSLTAIVFLLIWLYFCMYMVYIGAEINSLLKLYQYRKQRIEHKKEARKAKRDARNNKSQ